MPTQCRPHTAALAGRSDLTNQFVADIRSRFRPIRGRVRHFADYPTDGFGVSAAARQARLADGDADETPDSWPAAPRTADEIAGGNEAVAREFADWLRETLRARVLEPVAAGTEARLRRADRRDVESAIREWDHWTASYIRGAFAAAWGTAGDYLRVRGGRIGSTELPADRAIAGAFDIGVPVDTLRRLYLQAYDGLQRVVDDAAASTVRQIITEGFAAGIHPDEMAQQLTSEIAGLQRRRAEAHARTVTMHTRTQSTLGRYQAAGEDVVSHVEFSDAADARVCPFCRRLDGVEMTIEEMLGTHVLWRGDIYRLAPPSHVSGRCTPLPSVGGTLPDTPLSERVPGTIVTRTAEPTALSL